LLSSFALKYVIRKVQNIGNVKKNTEALLECSKEVGQEVNVEKTKIMFTPHHQNGGQNHNR